MLSEGQEVITKELRAVITGACIRGGYISYELSYFSGDYYKKYWVYPLGFDVDDAEKNIPGFNPSSNQLKLSSK